MANEVQDYAVMRVVGREREYGLGDEPIDNQDTEAKKKNDQLECCNRSERTRMRTNTTLRTVK